MIRKAVIINQNSGYLTIDIANAFSAHYDRTVLIAGRVKPMERALNPSVKIRKMIKYDRSSSARRLITWGWGTLQIFFLLLLRYRHYEVLYFTNPPMACLSSLLLRNRFSIVVYDAYPDALKNVGIKEGNPVYKIWSRWNKKLFARAEKVITLGEGMAKQLTQYVGREKIRVIPNWPGSDQFAPVAKEENPFIRELHFSDKFIVLYSGNMGLTHDLETIIEAAKKLEQNDHIQFVFIGEGEKKDRLVKLAEQYRLKNCTFLTWQPAEVLPYSLAAADLAVVALNEESAQLSVPSKTYNLMAVGAPFLCIAPRTSELALLVEKYHNGFCFEKDNLDEISSLIISLSDNKTLRDQLSVNSLKASKDFHHSNALKYL